MVQLWKTGFALMTLRKGVQNSLIFTKLLQKNMVSLFLKLHQ